MFIIKTKVTNGEFSEKMLKMDSHQCLNLVEIY